MILHVEPEDSAPLENKKGRITMQSKDSSLIYPRKVIPITDLKKFIDSIGDDIAIDAESHSANVLFLINGLQNLPVILVKDDAMNCIKFVSFHNVYLNTDALETDTKIQWEFMRKEVNIAFKSHSEKDKALMAWKLNRLISLANPKAKLSFDAMTKLVDEMIDYYNRVLQYSIIN